MREFGATILGSVRLRSRMGQNAFEFLFHENGNRRNIYDRKVICSNIKRLLLRGTFLCIFKAERISYQRISDYEKV